MFEKIVEVQDFIKLYNTNGFQDGIDFEYKLTSLLIKIQNSVPATECDCDYVQECECEDADEAYDNGYDEGYADGKAGKEKRY